MSNSSFKNAIHWMFKFNNLKTAEVKGDKLILPWKELKGLLRF